MSSVDPEIKDRLSRAVDPMPFEVEERLRIVHQRSSARVKARRVATVALAAVIAVGAVAAAWLLLPLRKDADRAGTGEPVGKIAYTRVTVTGEDINWDVHAASADGSEQTSLVTGPGAAYGPTWSPDGSQIAFISRASDASSPELWVVNADGSDARPIVQEPAPVGEAPAWSPDGTWIAFIAAGETESALWAVQPDGSGAHRVRRGNWQQVAWSPDGTKLALAGFGESGGAGLFVIARDGGGLTNLAEFDDVAALPTWSPDGTRIAVMVRESGDEFDYRYDIYSVSADGSETTRLTDWEGFDGFPVWSPDGRWIAISSDRDATSAQLSRNRDGEGWFGASLYLMRPDGSEFRLIVQAGEASLLATSWVR